MSEQVVEIIPSPNTKTRLTFEDVPVGTYFVGCIAGHSQTPTLYYRACHPNFAYAYVSQEHDFRIILLTREETLRRVHVSKKPTKVTITYV